MLHLRGSFIVFVVLLNLSFLMAACGPVEEAVPAGADLAVETPDIPVSTPTSRPEPTSTTAPTPTTEPAPEPTTELSTEIIEPATPITPTTAAGGVSVSPDILAQALPGSEEPLTAAIADLAQQTGRPPEEIGLVSIEAVDWSDASLGCPQEGYMYAQVITPGFRIILEADGQQYEYHTNQADGVILCQQDQ
jgi:hypothetical protein